MKRTLTLAISILLLLSFSLTSFASVSITHILKSGSPVEGDENSYFYTFAEYTGEDTPSDFGVIINGVKYSVGAEKVAQANADKKYGIGIADPENKLSDTYEVIPYVTVDGEDISGKPQKVMKSILYEIMNSEKVSASSEYICDDANSDLDYYSDWYLPDLREQGDKEDKDNTSGTYMQVSIHNGVNDETGNEILNRALIQLDLEKMEGADTTKPVELTVWGKATYWSGNMTNNIPKSFTVNAYGTYDYEWTEAGIASDVAYAGPSLSEIKAMPVIDSFEVAVPENTSETGTTISSPDWYAEKIDVAKIVEAARKAGKTKATVILLADNSDREKYDYEVIEESGDIINHDEVKFQMFTKDVTKSWLAQYKPTVSFFKYTDEYTELSKIAVNGEALKDFDAKTFDYSVGFEKGTDIPTVTAEKANAESRIVITQATAENNYTATIKVYDEQNIRSKTYTVTFIESLPSSKVTLKNIITDDANSRPNQYSDWYLPTGIYANVNLYNGAAYTSSSNGTLRRALIKLDLTKLVDVDLTKEINLNVVGIATYNGYTDTTLKTMTVDAYADYDTEWSESTLATDVSSVGPGITDILAMDKAGSFTVDVPATSGANNFENKSVNIAPVVKKAIDAGKDSVTIILIADNSERASLSNGGDGHPDRNDITFRIGTKENTDSSRQPSVSYYKFDSCYTDLAAIMVDGEAIEDFAANKFEYAAKYEDGTAIPVVTATAVDEDATVDIEQATAENGGIATITVNNENMTAKVYKVVFMPVVSNVLSDVITDDITSRISSAPVNEKTMFTNISNGAGPGWEGTLRRAYMQLDLTKFEDIENVQNVYLNITGYANLDKSRMSENTPTELKIDVYGIPSSQFNSAKVWTEDSIKKEVEDYKTANSKELTSVGPNITATKALAIQDSIILNLPKNESGNIATGRATQKIDITNIIKSVLAANAKLTDESLKETKVTIIFMADNTDRVQYKNADGSAMTPADDVSYRIHTKDETIEAYKPSISYTTYDSSIANLTTIEIDGTPVPGFNAETLIYTSSFEAGAAIPEVTATALYPNATVTVDPATEANGYVATITVANEGMTAKIYKVTFEVKRASALTSVSDAITDDACSRLNQNGVYNEQMLTNLYNGSNYQTALYRAYTQIDISKLSDVDLTKDIYLNTFGYINYGVARMSDTPPTEMKIDVYAIPSSSFETKALTNVEPSTVDNKWDEEEYKADNLNTFGPIPVLIERNLQPIQSIVLAIPEAPESGWVSSEVQMQTINITSIVKELIESNASKPVDEKETKITIIFMADNSSRMDKSASTKLEDGTTKTHPDDVKYYIYTKDVVTEKNLVYKPYVSYYKYN